MNSIDSLPPATGDYDVDRQRHAKVYLEGLGEEISRVSANRAELHRIRDERLGQLLNHAREYSPWHRERLRSVDLDAISGEDLSALPPMTKADLMANWDEIVCDPRLSLSMANEHIDRLASEGPAYLLDSYHAFATGGSTGERGVMVWDFEGFRIVGSRVPAWGISAATHAGQEMPTPVVIAFVGSEGAGHVGGAMTRCFSNPAMSRNVSIAASKPVEQIQAELEATQPHILGGYASALHELAERKLAGRLDIAPLAIIQGGEPLFPETRAVLSKAFGVPIRDMWGATEIGWGASSIPGHEGLVVSEDLVIIEPVDSEGASIPLGERAAKLLITNLVNRVMPIIRYEISDEVTLVAADPDCPWHGQRLLSVQGRLDDVFHYGDRMIHPHTFRTVFTRHASVSEYQIRQTRRGAEAIVVPSSDFAGERLEQDLVSALEKAGLPDPDVVLRPVEKIERHARSKKLKRFVPL